MDAYTGIFVQSQTYYPEQTQMTKAVSRCAWTCIGAAGSIKTGLGMASTVIGSVLAPSFLISGTIGAAGCVVCLTGIIMDATFPESNHANQINDAISFTSPSGAATSIAAGLNGNYNQSNSGGFLSTPQQAADFGNSVGGAVQDLVSLGTAKNSIDFLSNAASLANNANNIITTVFSPDNSAPANANDSYRDHYADHISDIADANIDTGIFANDFDDYWNDSFNHEENNFSLGGDSFF